MKDENIPNRRIVNIQEVSNGWIVSFSKSTSYGLIPQHLKELKAYQHYKGDDTLEEVVSDMIEDIEEFLNKKVDLNEI